MRNMIQLTISNTNYSLFTHVTLYICNDLNSTSYPAMHWDGAERGLYSSVAGKGEDLV